MTDVGLSAPERPAFTTRLLRSLQWVGFVIVLLLALLNLGILEHRRLPGFPEASAWILLAGAFALATLHLPAVFFRTKRWIRIGAYIAIFPMLVVSGQVNMQADAAFHRTPAGKVALEKEKTDTAKRAAAEAREAKAAGERAETQRILDRAKQTQVDLEAYEKKIEACFSWRGHRLSNLEEAVKDTLHNPDAFEHIETIAIVSDEQGNNVGMRFRAENGFGALRAATVKARIDVNDCSVQNIGETVVAD